MDGVECLTAVFILYTVSIFSTELCHSLCYSMYTLGCALKQLKRKQIFLVRNSILANQTIIGDSEGIMCFGSIIGKIGCFYDSWIESYKFLKYLLNF